MAKKNLGKHNFIAKSVVTNRDTSFAAKTKKPLENIFLLLFKTKQKQHSQDSYFLQRMMFLHLPKFCILWGNFELLPKKEVVNRYTGFAAKTKTTLKKGDFGQNKDITPKIYGILKQ